MDGGEHDHQHAVADRVAHLRRVRAMRALLLILVAASSALATPQSVISDTVGRVCVQVRGPFSLLGQALGQEAAIAITNGPTALASMGGAIDSTMSELGPIFLDHAKTVGRGRINFNLLGQTYALTSFDGVSLDPPSQTVVFSQPVVAARLTYDARIRQAAVGLALTYGLLERVDLSLLFPLVFTRVRVTATKQVTDVLQNGRFVPVQQPVMRATGEASSFAQGDLTVRGKYWFWDEPVALAATLAFQFPTGVPELLTGTGHYYVDPGLAASWPFWHGRAELTAAVGMLIDASNLAFSKVSYGIGASAVVIPERLGAVLEIFGQSDIAAHLNPQDTAVLTLLSNRTLAQQPALDLFFTRTDQVNLSVGLRAPIAAWDTLALLVFATAVIPLNDQGLRPTGAFLTLGMGSNF